MKPLTFHIEAAGELRPVELHLASEADVRSVRTWRKMKSYDAGEFAALAAKRWFYYSREGATVASREKLTAAIRRNERAELAFLLVATASWTKRYRFLAVAYCRRTWCHHLALDFLAVRPNVSIGNKPIRGIGSGILGTLTELADSLKMETIWGEATATSAPFYEKVLQTGTVKDLFVIQRDTMQRILSYHREKEKSSLAKAPQK